MKVRQPRVARRRIAFEQHAHAERARRRFDGGDELEVVLERLDRRHEDVQDAAARLDAQRRADDAGGRFAARRRTPVASSAPACSPAAGRDCCGRIGTPSSARPATRGRGIVAPPGCRERRARRERIELVDRQDDRPATPTAASRAAAEVPSASRRASDRAARSRRNHAPRRPASVPAADPPKRQRVADDRVQTLREDAAQAVALQLVVEARVERIDVHRQLPFAPEVVPDVFVARLHVAGGDAELRRRARVMKRSASAAPWPSGCCSSANERRVVSRPARRRRASSSRAPSAAAARPDTTCPVRSARSRSRRSAASAGAADPRRAARLVGPSAAVFHSSASRSVDRHERRLAAHRQAHVAGGEVGVDRAPAREDRLPLRRRCRAW